MMGAGGAGSSSGMGPVAGEGEAGVRGEEEGRGAKGLRRNISTRFRFDYGLKRPSDAGRTPFSNEDETMRF